MDTTTTAGATAFMADQPIPARRPVRAVPPPEDFLLDDWLVQPTLGRLSRADKTLRLRPQLMDVLVCLASGDGRTVGRQQLLDTVWDDRFVSETAVARSVAELRHALGDDARQPRIIQTIPKRGYRIIAPIAWGASIPTAEITGPPEASPLTATRFTTGFWPLVVLLAAVITVVLLLLVRRPARLPPPRLGRPTAAAERAASLRPTAPRP